MSDRPNYAFPARWSRHGYGGRSSSTYAIQADRDAKKRIFDFFGALPQRKSPLDPGPGAQAPTNLIQPDEHLRQIEDVCLTRKCPNVPFFK